MSEVPLYQHASPTAIFGGEPPSSERERERERKRERALHYYGHGRNEFRPEKAASIQEHACLASRWTDTGYMYLANKKMLPPKTLQ